MILRHFIIKVQRSVQIRDVKERMNHLKVMNCRQNMLREIRNRRVDPENEVGLT